MTPMKADKKASKVIKTENDRGEIHSIKGKSRS